MSKTIWAAIGVLAAGVVAWQLWGGSTQSGELGPIVDPLMHGAAAGAPATPADEIVVPELSALGAIGRAAFEANCVSCHGRNAAGSDKGPPLVHLIYEPGHHGDFAFVRAVRGGVRAHHWRFGDMAPIEGITDEQIGLIIGYVREMQRANGID